MKRLFLFCTIFVSISLITHNVRAESFHDPVSPMSWEQMKSCELVVAAHYQSHDTGAGSRDDQDVKSGISSESRSTLTLSIDRVLKGANVKPGDAITIDLRHLYSVETYPVDESWREKISDGVPRLCYKIQPKNPGGLTPRQIVSDVRQNVLYFLPKASTPFLEQIGQVQMLDFEKDWEAALHGFTPSLEFRATQNFSEKLRESALDEIYATRNPITLDLLFNRLVSAAYRDRLGSSAQRALMAIGDHKGDVYNRARKRFLAGADDWLPDDLTPDERFQYRRAQKFNEETTGRHRTAMQCAQIMAMADGERAAREFVVQIQQKHIPISDMALDQLGSTNSDYALDFAFRLLEHPETVRQGAEIIRKLLVPGYRQGFSYRTSTSRTAHLTTLTRARLKKVLQLPIYQTPDTSPDDVSRVPSQQQFPLATLREILGGFLPREVPEPVSLTYAEQTLLQPAI
ncbi:hypothetical protein EON80_11870, partial [bacterium]